jgi:methylated-DNA-[protein]-cysteine S-methyltransferase
MLKSVDVTEFQQRVYHAVKMIPKGKITTYKHVASYLNKPGASQAVGNALRNNPFAPVVPCHRVLPSTYEIGGFFGQTSQ